MTDTLNLPLLSTGVPGLDSILGGGLPELSFNIIGGAPGCGKTTLAQQIMFHMASPERKALFFTAMGEPPVKMLRYQQQFRFFDLDKVGSSVEFVSLAPSVEAGDYDRVLAQILEQVQQHAPALVFIDSFRSFVQGARGDQQEIAALQNFVQKLAMHMAAWNATSFLIGEYTSNEADQNPIFTVADGLIWLTHSLQRNTTSLKIQVVKMRGQKQRLGLHGFRIGSAGIEVFPRMLPPPEAAGPRLRLPRERLSSGVPVLDEMLGGGIPLGYSTLVVGPTGSGKTLLATEFLAAGAANGETGVIALFERHPSQMMNEKLGALVAADQVRLMSLRALDQPADEMLHELLALIDATGARRVVLDSLPGFELAMAPDDRDDFREALYRMTTVLSTKGVTILMTSELEDRFNELRFSPYGSAVLVDVVIMLRYLEVQSELRTVVSVIKVRGSRHSRQIRSFEISEMGIAIGEGPSPFEGVLLGHSPAG